MGEEAAQGEREAAVCYFGRSLGGLRRPFLNLLNVYLLFIALITAAICVFGLQSARALISRSFITPLFAQVCFFARCSHNERFIPSS